MEDVKMGISDLNEGRLEGTVKSTPRMSTGSNGKKALNFTLESMKVTRAGVRYFLHELVAFEPVSLQFADLIKDGIFMRVSFHLMTLDIPVGTGDTAVVVKTSKPVVTFVELESPDEPA